MATRSSRLLTALLALVLGGGLLAAPADARPRPRPEPVLRLAYDALGDSYGSGFGVPPYSETCGRSESSYAGLLDGLRVGWFHFALDDFVACAGATTVTLVEQGQLRALDGRTRLVTLSIGGNDIGWSRAVRDCLLGPDEACATTQAEIRALITDELPGLLATVHRQVRRRAPRALVVVTGYPRLFSPEAGDYLAASPAEQTELNEGADLLNATVRDSARRHGLSFVDVTERFVGHGANAADPWILGIADPGAFHPNATGYEAYADAVAAAFGVTR